MLNIVSILFNIIICFAHNLDLKPIKLITNISKQSYSLYLIHNSIFIYFMLHYVQQNFIKNTALFLLSLIIAYYMSKVLYLFYEKPIMDLRDKEKKKNIYYLIYTFCTKKIKNISLQ